MADKTTASEERQKYVDDPRIACKYGTKCYQKNTVHLEKYKHPPPKRSNNEKNTQPAKKFKRNTDFADDKVNVLQKDEGSTNKEDKLYKRRDSEQDQADLDNQNSETTEKPSVSDNNKKCSTEVKPSFGRTPKDFDNKEFIRSKFLVEMPNDFYQFWDFCKKLKEKNPLEALKDVGLTLVGPFDVLAGKFNDIEEQPDENYLIHWRYYFDPPEFQTVLKGDEKTGYHIGYFRDSPEDMPVFLACNFANSDGVFQVKGDNIFSAVYLFLEDLKKTGDPFKKMHIGRIQGAIKKKAEELKLELSEKTDKIRERNKKIVTRSFNKIGIVVPYNRKTQVGYRDLGITNKELVKILDKIKNALPEQKQKFLSDLQSVMTNASIATDECDFGAGIELGLDILAHGVDTLNQTAARYLATNYRLINREAFAKIAEAHMENRKKGTNLSIL